MAVRTFISMAEMREARHGWHKQNLKLVLIPTMGALHDGHLSLVRHAKKCGDVTLATIFVNPKQFGPGEDFATYPRTVHADLEKLKFVGADGVFLPNAADMYPEGFQTSIHNSGLSQGLCGGSRPGHFDGVLTVVMKLFNITQPHAAVFGKKDYQQFRVIERMVEDLDMPVEVIGCPTVREPDGLAMSSRNAYLNHDERLQALGISKSLTALKDAFTAGASDATALEDVFQSALSQYPKVALEYFALRTQTRLEPVTGPISEPVVAMVAAKVGTTRLIDNIELAHE